MPPLTDERTKECYQRVDFGLLQRYIAEQNGIGAGTVSSIIANYKVGLEELDFDSISQLAVEARQHGLNWSDLGSRLRLYNYFIKSGANENGIESFITNVNSGYIPLGKAIELINQIYDISKSESVPPEQLR